MEFNSGFKGLIVFSEGVSAERQVKKSRDKKKDKLSRRSFTFGEKEI